VTDWIVLPYAAVADALTANVPLTVAPFAGEATDTVVGSLFTVMVMEAVPDLAFESVAVTVRVWVPLLKVYVFSMNE
jgi:hypothetical protein